MTLLATFTFGDTLLAILEFALLFMWIWVAIGVVMDVFRSHDLSGFAKAMWILLIIIIPLFGVLIYVIVRGHGMTERNLKTAQEQQSALDQYIRTTAQSPADRARQARRSAQARRDHRPGVRAGQGQGDQLTDLPGGVWLRSPRRRPGPSGAPGG